MNSTLDTLLASLAPDVRRALELSHEALLRRGIPHALCGGLAVNAHGHRYATRDVDYLVAESDAFDGTVILTHKPGVPIQVGKVAIDYVMADAKFPRLVQEAMSQTLAHAQNHPEECAVVSAWLLVWMKLNAGRPKDIAAVVGLLESGMDYLDVEEKLLEVGDARVLASFNRCVAISQDASPLKGG